MYGGFALNEHVVENEAVLRVILVMHLTKQGQNLNNIYTLFITFPLNC